MATNYTKGKLGENIASSFLKNKGYLLIDKNFRTRSGEIDLIGTKDNRLIFFEIKLKTINSMGTPEEMITKTKIARILMTAQSYLMLHKNYTHKYPVYQIDSVCIVLDKVNKPLRIDHYENISCE